MSEITDQIWVGNYGDACNETFLSERKITHIINCANELQSSIFRPGYKIQVVDDVADAKTKKYFLEAASVLDRWVREGNKIMVHCYAGMSRSVSVVITYFMVYRGWSYDVSYRHLKQRRFQTNPHPDFIPILKEIEALPRLQPQPHHPHEGLEAPPHQHGQ
jgi:atypical dual specificity phosphatase